VSQNFYPSFLNELLNAILKQQNWRGVVLNLNGLKQKTAFRSGLLGKLKSQKLSASFNKFGVDCFHNR